MLMCFPKIYIVFCDRAARSWLARGVPRPQIVMAGVSDSKTSDLNYEARVPKKSRQVVAGVWGSKTPDLNYEARVPKKSRQVMAGVRRSKTPDLNYQARLPKKSKIRSMTHVDFFSFLSKDIDSILRSATDPPIGLDATDPGFWVMIFDDLCWFLLIYFQSFM